METVTDTMLMQAMLLNVTAMKCWQRVKRAHSVVLFSEAQCPHPHRVDCHCMACKAHILWAANMFVGSILQEDCDALIDAASTCVRTKIG
eukprot:1153268-Pelagomonas_calceolata.AAC.3